MFKMTCIIAVFSCTTASFANNSIVSAETRSSQIKVSQLAGDKTPGSDESFGKLSSGKEHSTLKRLQIGLFPNRAEVDKAAVRLRQLDFETWIIPFNDEYAVSIGAFSSQSNLERALKRLTAAGFTDKIQIIVVDKKVQHSQNIAPTQVARSTLFDARTSQAEGQYVPKKKYEKLEQEVELLKSQMQMLMKEKSPSEQSSKSTSDSAAQTSTEPSEIDPVVVSSEESATAPENESDDTDSDDVNTEEDKSLAEGSREEEAEDAKRQMDMFLREQTVLFKRGELELEFGLNYSQDTAVATCFNADNSSAFCSSGSKPIPKSHTRSVDTSLGITYGIADDLALSLSIPYSYSELEADFTSFDVATPVKHGDQLGIGDVSGSLRYTAWHEKGSIPGITFNVNAKSATGNDEKIDVETARISPGLGTGFWNVGGGVSLTKTFDPVVFFGSLGYTATLQDDGVDPGDQISYSFGGGFSLNDRVSVKTVFSGSTVLRREVDGREIPGSAQDISSLQFSSTIKVSKALFVEPFVAFGLTRESGDFTVGLRVPYRFGEKFPLPFFHD
jgi:cell division septation protein DedD